MARPFRRGLLFSTAFSVAAFCAAADAHAQTRREPPDPSVPSLFEPHFDGDAARPQQFRKPGTPARAGAVTMPSSGVGTTGFDATHSRARKKAKDNARKRALAEAENLPPIVSSGPDRTVAAPFQRQESAAAQRRRAINSAAAPLDATGAITARPVRRRIVEEDPFGPTGIRRGAFIFKPEADVSGGYNSNPSQRLNGKGSTFEKVEAGLKVQSDWVRHEVSADLRGSYIWYNDNGLSNLSKPDVNLKGNARLDISKQTKADFEGRFAYAADNPGDPNLPTDVAKPPNFIAPGATAGITHTFNRLVVSLKGIFDRTAYGDAELNNGELLDLRDRNYNQYGTKLRLGYETLPGITPFIEFGADTRKHDQPVDSSGVQRDSDGQTYKIGTSFELSRYLIGEASVGWLEREYADPSFEKLHGTLLDASLTYYATPLTTLKLDVKTTVDESVLAGVSGALQRDYGLQIDHAFRRWLIGTVKLGYGTDNYEGSPREDQRYIVSGALIYKATRDLHIKGEIRREWLRSTIPTQDYTSNIFMLGMRLQR